ncbi:MAG: phosphate ABC transporter permease PstA [Peptococcaceae bacterium]|nr:phosphate ABC transporter permease PstA [Peptococcaceae bacterium]
MTNMLKSFKGKKLNDIILLLLVYGSAALSVTILVFIIGYILFNGVPHLKPSFFSISYDSTNVSVFPAIVNTLIMISIALAIAVPLGVFSAIYLVEYAKKTNKLVKVVRITAETLVGIPSIVYGLFGLLFFVTYLKWGVSLMAGSFTLAIMILPLVIRSTEESLKAVPDSFREGCFALGAGKLRTIYRIILPSAAYGILAGVILAVGKIVGETAALIYTSGTVAQIPDSVFGSGRTMALHIYALSSEGLHTNEAFATAVVLLIVVIGINALSALTAKKLSKESKH